jgi:glycine/D-amino acid oxidase-like deaminating enzyme
MSFKTYDVAIIGGGFAGSALAYYCSNAGASVLLLEANSICSGTSSACAGRAQIIESESDEYLDLVLSGFEKLDQLSDELDTDLEWELPNHLTLLFNQDQWQQYAGLTERLNKRHFTGEMLDCHNLQKLEPHLQTSNFIGAALSAEGHLNPFKFCLAFASKARQLGANIITHSPVTGFISQNNKITMIQCGTQVFSANIVILAAGAWSGKLASLAGSHLPMRFTHAEAFVTEPVKKVICHHIGISGFYEAVHGSNRTVTLGLGQHPNGTIVVSNAIQTAVEIDCSSTSWGMPAIAGALSRYFPVLNPVNIVRTWSMPSPFLPDFLPAIGWLPEFDNLFVAAGFHLAIPTIPLLAQNIANIVQDKNNSYSSKLLEPFSPGRFIGQY